MLKQSKKNELNEVNNDAINENPLNTITLQKGMSLHTYLEELQIRNHDCN